MVPLSAVKRKYIMAHELEFVNGVAQMAYAGDLPWHGLGTQVPADLSPEQMMQAAGLDWEVEKFPVFAEVNGKRIDTGRQALIRTSDNKFFDVVGDDWNPVQNREAFEFFNDFIAAGDMEMHTAGSLKGGRNIWALAKVNESFEILGGDQVEGYLLFSNPHQYGKTVDVRFTPIRVVCNNTLTMSLNGKVDRMFKMNHRRVFDGDLVKEVLGVSKEKLAKYKEMAEYLSQKRYSNESIVEYFNRVFPMTSNKKEANPSELQSRAAKLAYEVLETQPGAEYAAGSWWQAFNAVTYSTDHLLGRSADTRLTSAWFGSNQRRKIEAANLAVEMAEAA
jgi:phage/plasmid-like protein (TIGR03299 family)